MYQIDFYREPDGNSPFEDYLKSIDRKLRAKTYRSLQILREFGPDLREPNTKHLGDGIYELRTAQGGNAGRSLFFFYADKTIVITHGFLKKTNKIPSGEIDRAKRYKIEYLKSH